MTDVATTDRCTVCGTALILGSCALHGSSRPPLAAVAPPAAPARPAPVAPESPVASESKVAWPIVAAIVLLLVLVGGLAIVWRTTGAIQSDQRAAIDGQDELIDQLRDQVAAAEDAVRLADERIVALEAKAGGQTDTVAVAAQVQPSVWTVETPGGVGSGFFLGDGQTTRSLVTNYHVVADVWEAGGRTVVVLGEGDQRMDGTIERVHEYADLALVTVAFDQPALKRAAEPPTSGDSVIAVGSPLGLGGSVSTGIVSAVRVEGGDSVIQFTAPVSPGSSGGPIVNGRGEVIGVTMSKAVGFGAEGLSFAIPVSQICTALEHCS